MLLEKKRARLSLRSSTTTLLAWSFVLACILGCSGGGKTCVGLLTYEGQTFRGEGKTDAEARQFACNGYCRDADPEYDARYRIWLDSPRGRAAGSPSKKEAIFKDRGLLDYVTITCANRCVTDAKAGKYKIDVNCK